MIELTTSLLMLASVFSTQGTTSDVAGATAPTVATTTVSQMISTESYVRNYFEKTPILAEVARCESTFRQFDRNGNIIRGKVNSDDVGVMQINTYYHEDSAVRLGYDIYTIDGNLGYASYLYKKYGLDPWSSSSRCWKTNPVVAVK